MHVWARLLEARPHVHLFHRTPVLRILLTATLAAVAAATAVHAQSTVTIGTGAAPSAMYPLSPSGEYIGQSFVAAGNRLHSFALWQAPRVTWLQEGYHPIFMHGGALIVKGFGIGNGPQIWESPLDPSRSGRVDFQLGSPLHVDPGQIYTLLLWTHTCGPESDCIGLATTDQSAARDWELEYTQGDAYTGGMMASDTEGTPELDLRFEMQFSTVPEPQQLALLGVGLAGLAFAWRRRRAAV